MSIPRPASPGARAFLFAAAVCLGQPAAATNPPVDADLATVYTAGSLYCYDRGGDCRGLDDPAECALLTFTCHAARPLRSPVPCLRSGRGDRNPGERRGCFEGGLRQIEFSFFNLGGAVRSGAPRTILVFGDELYWPRCDER